MRLAFVVDYPNRAWDITARECIRFGDFEGDVFTQSDLANKPELDRYNFILLYPWTDPDVRYIFERYGSIVIPCIAAGDQASTEALEYAETIFGKVKIIGACNRELREIFQRRFPGKAVIHMTHGVNTHLFGPSGESVPFAVGWVGRPSWSVKRITLAELITKRVKNTPMYVAGFYGENDFPYYTHNAMPQFYHKLGVLLVTSKFEAHPLCVYEAMSCGIPVVTMAVGDVTDYVVSDVNGIVINKDLDPDNLVSHVSLILQNLKDRPEYRKRLGDNARRTIVQNLDWKKVIESYNRLDGM